MLYIYVRLQEKAYPLQNYTANQMELLSIQLDFSGKVWNKFVYATAKKFILLSRQSIVSSPQSIRIDFSQCLAGFHPFFCELTLILCALNRMLFMS